MGRTSRVTLRDISADTGLSVAAVSYALRGLHVPEETQLRVRESARRLGYQVDPIARALASGRTDHVGLICRSLADLWQQSVAADLGRALLRTGRQALIVDACDDAALEARLARRLLAQRVDALVVMPVDPTAEHWAQCARDSVLISIGDALPYAEPHAEIVFDNENVVREALGRLLDLGHRRVVVLTPIAQSTPDRPTELVVQDLDQSSGASIRLQTCTSDLVGSAAVARRMLTSPAPPTAFLCLSDSMAYGVYQAARELELSVPADISVLGNDGNPFSSLLTPPLATYEWPLAPLIEAVSGAVTLGVEAQKRAGRTVITARPLIRGSMAAAPAERSDPGRD